METTALTMFNQTVKYEQEYIWLKPVCDFFKINYENQTRKIKNDPILANQSTKKSNSLMFGDKYPRILLTKKGFIRWVQIVNANTIVESLREKFVKFQELIFDFLYGSADEQKKAKVNYARLQKLENLKAKIGIEIKRVRKELKQHWGNRYLQTTIPFNS